MTKMPSAGGAPTTLLSSPAATSQNHPLGDILGDIRVDATSIYWVDFSWVDNGTGAYTPRGALMKMPLTGGTPITLAPAQPPVPNSLVRSYMAVDTTSIYWMGIADDDGGTESFAVMKIPRDGGTPTLLASGLAGGGGIAVDATNVYWTGFDTTAGGTVMKVALSGGAPTVIASHQVGPGGIAVDATSVYWTNAGDGTVMKLTPK